MYHCCRCSIYTTENAFIAAVNSPRQDETSVSSPCLLDLCFRYATGDSNTGPSIEKVRNATIMARNAMPDIPFEGPIQYDAAVDPRVASVKYKGEPNQVAGRANVLIFPDLNTGL